MRERAVEKSRQNSYSRMMLGLLGVATVLGPTVPAAAEGPILKSVPDVRHVVTDALTLVRVRYDSVGGFGESWYRHDGRNWQRWETDFPQAEENLLFRLQQITSLKVNPKPVVLRLSDEAIFDHPFLFMSDVGWQRLERAERRNLAAYLERGGFLWVDDFWGEAELANFNDNLGGLREGWQWRPVPEGHAIFRSVYALERCPQIPARIFFERFKQPYDPPGIHRYPAGGLPGVRNTRLLGLFDTESRLMAIATHNTDIADGWEREGESKEYFDRFSLKSYAFTINVIVYAMTH